ncbi:MAG: glutamine synthetase family protein [Halobacteriota archaeon]|uniref:glutamine synthetase family protein n=1 Tax=Natronomonas sp. TaxID=2184060 RepID=UPI0039763BA4
MTLPENVEAVLEDPEVEHLFVEIPDIDGVSRSKQIDADYAREKWEDGFSMNMLILAVSAMTDVPEGTGYGEAIDFADGTIVPDPETFQRLPWRDDAARVICDFDFRGDPAEAYTRRVLHRVLAEARDTLDASFGVGNELEFHLLDRTEDGYKPVTDHPHEYVTRHTERVRSFYDKVKRWSDAMDISVQSIQHEYGAGQFEVLFDYGSPLETSDRAFTFREVVKEAAATGGRKATFMAKPLTDSSANGYHLHVSAFDGSNNVFAGEEGLSETGKAFVGGLLEHADALVALGCPTLNGFKRFTPGSFSPYTRSWGYNNRTAAIRVPEALPTRIENRIPGAAANPYLVLAGTLAAGLHGVRAELDPGEPVSGDAQRQRPSLVQSPEMALRALETDDELVEILGEQFVHVFTTVKRHELSQFNDYVTDWERRYLKVI